MSDRAVPLICDSPPRRKVILISPGPITPEQAARLRHMIEHADFLVLEQGWEVHEIGGAADWPDAEFCAA